ncbi:hypothetical protein C3432_19135 [Citrobacter amalonaticus]|uniref:Trimeric autotransporter adhesin YadA-like C-terminal membrane anchor domain-containing protein n=1 Tax=Citrobacter amalonaticus TaxID=35703 RepID=A0A2S4RXE2_CITAM|nr:collagen-like protein [Citrobacter amalonaticus]POT56094.1 hypothetical protein C3432_19135 [Citrobacter amalonaticus]POT74403.1 hypothetical protein C3436_16775 [Citrobacter amalonaticus]POU65203.1 hypothetical protein C3430_13515 [Citrobacter amalonaticus]POV04037.1 hypothetical protein C3424_18455 [Citrobacter amalonaticus]
MKKTLSAFVFATVSASTFAANSTSYDSLQDQMIDSLRLNGYDHSAGIQRNAYDIRSLNSDTAAKLSAVNAYVNQVQQQSNDHDAAQDAAIRNLQNMPVARNGVSGRDGIDGKAGHDGKDGAQGQSGATGATGRAGAQGARGLTGAAGHDGKDGVTAIVQQTAAADLETKAQAAKNEQDIAELKRDVRNLGASAQASANLHYNANQSGYAVAVGQYESSTAIAGGMQFQANAHSAVTVQASYDGTAAGGSLGFHSDF